MDEDKNENITTHKMKIVNEIKKTLNRLIVNNIYSVTSINYYEESFGNIIVVLSSSVDIDIIFIKDRTELYCQFESKALPKGERFYEYEIFRLIGIKSTSKYEDFLEMMSDNFRIITENWSAIKQLFDENHLADTMQKIKGPRKEMVKKLMDHQNQIQNGYTPFSKPNNLP